MAAGRKSKSKTSPKAASLAKRSYPEKPSGVTISMRRINADSVTPASRIEGCSNAAQRRRRRVVKIEEARQGNRQPPKTA